MPIKNPNHAQKCALVAIADAARLTKVGEKSHVVVAMEMLQCAQRADGSISVSISLHDTVIKTPHLHTTVDAAMYVLAGEIALFLAARDREQQPSVTQDSPSA